MDINLKLDHVVASILDSIPITEIGVARAMVLM